ncbi:hypothetical protein [Photorhabdus antumapuensis]|uniref:hypothetical protein n=1 Tax=Photorhabdus antumapuensis TaxID=2862867 RepID=UPI001CEC9C55|nr:hypothetical protein [Photorhabdus antumapuensis]MCA6222364.1 hypothetical protein [Photorhabdus antumapuensis]
MKSSIINLILLVIICAATYSFGLVAVEWLLTDRSIYQLDWMKSLKLGSLLGGIGGIVIWLMYRFNIR